MSRHVTPEHDPRSRFGLYRLCDCSACSGRGRIEEDRSSYPPYKAPRCPDCRGEGRIRQEVATAETPEAVGVALVTLARESEWEECPFGLLDREPSCERCGGSGQEPFNDDIDSSQNPWVKVTCDECEGSGVKASGTWLVLPWTPSARNVTDAARTLARSKKSTP